MICLADGWTAPRGATRRARAASPAAVDGDHAPRLAPGAPTGPGPGQRQRQRVAVHHGAEAERVLEREQAQHAQHAQHAHAAIHTGAPV